MKEKVKLQPSKVNHQSPEWDIDQESLQEPNERLVKKIAKQMSKVIIVQYQM